VYRAEDTRLAPPVAIKLLSPQFTADHEFQKRFEREARLIAALDHPHIRPVYDVGEHEGSRYLVMPLLEGETLAARLRRGPLTLGDVLKHGASLSRARSTPRIERMSYIATSSPATCSLARAASSCSTSVWGSSNLGRHLICQRPRLASMVR
jgi:serine/threonine protein kinase